jgi:SAM-dependent methyltransferase
MEAEEYGRFSLEVWDTIAPGWERWRAHLENALSPVRQWLVRELAPEPGDTVLELSAGPGGTGFAVAAALGENGRLISTDFSPEMLEVARRRGAELGLTNVEYRLVDAQRIELDADSIDGVLCQNGYMLMSDPAAALSETCRVLRPGSRLALAVWGAPDRNPWAAIGAMTLIQRGHMQPPEPGSPGVFNMASEERTRGLLQGAGFTDVRTEEVPVAFAFDSVDEYVSWTADVSGPFALIIRGLSDEERSAISEQLAEAFTPFSANCGYELPGVCLTAVAHSNK